MNCLYCKLKEDKEIKADNIISLNNPNNEEIKSCKNHYQLLNNLKHLNAKEIKIWLTSKNSL